MTDEWLKAVTPYIDMTRDVQTMLARILERDETCGILSAEERAQLNRRSAINGDCLYKMETRTFEVAVVGLENSGKSTVANALIGIAVLPSASVRCTYTTTEIRADEREHAQVSFYTPEEFRERFSRMLTELDFPVSKTSFDTLSLGAFTAHWEKMQARDPLKFRMFDTTTAEDVRAILRSRTLITEYLGRPPVEFEGAQQLVSAEFQSFITGCYDEQDVLKRDDRPFAVKKVTIWSSSLKHMQNVLLYDVPGFNSPTLLHKEQTKRMMDRADAIVMVADILANPNIDGTQLSMLKESDEDHVQLKDKLFVFGNKADLLVQAKTFRDNYQTFISDIVRKHRLTSERRVLAGSARAYFARLSGQEETHKKLEALGIDDGIDRLRAMLNEYYQSERLNVLITRAVRNCREILTILIGASERFAHADGDALQMREFAVVIQAKDDMLAFRRGARDIVGRMYRDISKRRPFTHILIQRVQERIRPINASDSLYLEILGSLNVQGDGANRNELVNANVRMNLQGYFNSLIERMVWDIAKTEETALMDELTDEFLRALSFDEKNNPHAAALKESAHALVMRMFDAEEDDAGQSTPFRARGFIALVTRFVPGATAAIIGYPLGSTGRTEEVVRLSDELIRLYTARGDGARDVDGMACLAKILTHQDYYALLKARNVGVLEKFMRSRRNLRAALDDASIAQFIDRWSQLSTQYDIDLTGRLAPHTALYRQAARIGTYMDNKRDDASTPYSRLNDLFSDAIAFYMKTRTRPLADDLPGAGGQETDRALPGRSQVLSDLISVMARRAVQARTEEEILAEINEDILLFAQMLIDLLLPHLNLEKAFYERFINQINAMTGYSSVYDHKADALVNQWLEKHVKQVKNTEFAQLDVMRKNHEDKRQIFELIEALRTVWAARYEQL